MGTEFQNIHDPSYFQRDTGNSCAHLGGLRCLGKTEIEYRPEERRDKSTVLDGDIKNKI